MDGPRALLIVCVLALGCSGAAEPPPLCQGDECPEECKMALACPTFGPPDPIATINDPILPEVSGLQQSPTNDGLFWVHNDSGGEPEVYAIDSAGTLLTTLVLGGQIHVDWEDIAIGPGAASMNSHIYVADMGDNDADRPEIRILRFLEPNFSVGPQPQTQTIAAQDIETFRLTYPEGPQDAEALIVDPIGPTIYVVTKDRTAGISRVYSHSAIQAPANVSPMTLLASVDFGSLSAGNGAITGGSMSPDRRVFAVRDLTTAFAWPLHPTCDIGPVLTRAPCLLALAAEPKGEALSLSNESLYTTSENVGQPIYRYQVTIAP